MSDTSPEASPYITDLDHVLSPDLPLPALSDAAEMGITNQQWLNAYIARRSDFFERRLQGGDRPTITAFHETIGGRAVHGVTTLDKVSASIYGVAFPRLRISHVRANPAWRFSLTEDGANDVIENLWPEKAVSLAAENREQLLERIATPDLMREIGQRVLDGRYTLLDRSTRKVVDLLDIWMSLQAEEPTED